MTIYDVKEYVTKDNKSPFGDAIKAMRDQRAKVKLVTSRARMKQGNFGDHKGITNSNGVMEVRIKYGPGYRIYYAHDGKKVILLLTCGDKSTQFKDIEKAKQNWKDYNERKTKGEV